MVLMMAISYFLARKTTREEEAHCSMVFGCCLANSWMGVKMLSRRGWLWRTAWGCCREQGMQSFCPPKKLQSSPPELLSPQGSAGVGISSGRAADLSRPREHREHLDGTCSCPAGQCHQLRGPGHPFWGQHSGVPQPKPAGCFPALSWEDAAWEVSGRITSPE